MPTRFSFRSCIACVFVVAAVTGCAGNRTQAVDYQSIEATTEAGRYLAYSQLALERNELDRAKEKLADAQSWAEHADLAVSHRIHLQHVQILLAEHNLVGALSLLQEERFRGIEESDRQFLLGRCHLRLGDTFEAIIAFKESLAKASEDARKQRAADMLRATEIIELLTKSTPVFAERVIIARDHLEQICSPAIRANVEALIR